MLDIHFLILFENNRRPKSVVAKTGRLVNLLADREKNVASEVAATLSPPTQWFQCRLY